MLLRRAVQGHPLRHIFMLEELGIQAVIVLAVDGWT